MRCVLHFVLLIVLFLNLGRAVAAGQFAAEPQDNRVESDKAAEAVPPGKQAAPWETPTDLMQMFYSKSTQDLIKVSALQREAGNRLQSLETLNQAANLAMESEVPALRGKTIPEIVSLLIQAGELSQAESVAKKLEGEFSGSGIPAAFSIDIVRAQIAAGFHQQALTSLQQAEETARKMPSSLSTALILREIALAQIEAGDKEHGLATLMQAGETREPSWIIGDIIRDLVAVREFERALELARTIEEASSMLDGVNTIVAVLIRDGQFQHALSVARSMDQRTQLPSLPSVLETAIVELARADQLEQASQAAREMPPGPGRQYVLIQIAEILANKGEVDKAKDLAQLIDGVHNWNVNQLIVWALVERGEFEQALKIAESIGLQHHRVNALRSLVDPLCTAGEFDLAVEVCQKTEVENHFGTSWFSVVVWALCEAGNIDEAVELTRAD